MKKLLLLISLLLLTTACATNQPKLKIGTTDGVNLQILKFINDTQMPLEIIVFKDYSQLNTATRENKIQLNFFQNQIYLEQNNPQNDLVAIKKAYLSPMGIYSNKYNKDTLPKKLTIAIPNDDIGKLRATRLLEKLTLTKSALSLQQTDLNKPLPDNAELFILPLEYAQKNGFDAKSALALEDTNSPFTQLLVTTTKNQNNPQIQQFLNTYKSQQTTAYIQNHFPYLIIAK